MLHVGSRRTPICAESLCGRRMPGNTYSALRTKFVNTASLTLVAVSTGRLCDIEQQDFERALHHKDLSRNTCSSCHEREQSINSAAREKLPAYTRLGGRCHAPHSYVLTLTELSKRRVT
jgi:hypothetical protein